MPSPSPLPEPAALPPHPTLPDPLRMRDGRPVTTPEMWREERAPELRALFQHYMYGALPSPRPVSAVLLREDRSALGGIATLREMELEMGLPEPVHFLILIPNARTRPAPCFLGMNFYGNYQVLDDPGIALPRGWVSRSFPDAEPHRAAEAGRGLELATWSVRETVARGYAFATFYSGDVVPDEPALAEEALGGFRPNPGSRGGSDPGTLAAWAWGFSRCMDHLATLPEIDAARIAAVGHSRNGKTALLAAAMDERFALAIPSQAGCGGTGPSRLRTQDLEPQADGRPRSENLACINQTFPHWFSTRFWAFNESPDRLPFDQHCLIALCAPRPILLSNATEDLWANPEGQLEMLRAAAPVYALLGHPTVPPPALPSPPALHNERLGYFLRTGAHKMTTTEWAAWLDYADRWLQ